MERHGSPALNINTGLPGALALTKLSLLKDIRFIVWPNYKCLDQILLVQKEVGILRHIVPMTQRGMDKKKRSVNAVTGGALEKAKFCLWKVRWFTQELRFGKAILNDQYMLERAVKPINKRHDKTCARNKYHFS